MQDAVDAHPWLTDGPIPFEVEWSMGDEAQVQVPSARTGTADGVPTVRA